MSNGTIDKQVDIPCLLAIFLCLSVTLCFTSIAISNRLRLPNSLIRRILIKRFHKLIKSWFAFPVFLWRTCSVVSTTVPSCPIGAKSSTSFILAIVDGTVIIGRWIFWCVIFVGVRTSLISVGFYNHAVDIADKFTLPTGRGIEP